MSEKRVLTPNPDCWSGPFWAAAAQHKLVFQQCTSCGARRYPAGPRCSECGGRDYEWAESPGDGAVLSWVTFHQNYYPEYDFTPPYEVVLVQLDDGPRMIAGVVPSTRPSMGLRVRAVFADRQPGFSLPLFQAAADHD